MSVPQIKTCSEQHPYRKEDDDSNTIWVHPHAFEIGGDTITKRCPTCGIEWKAELPQ